MEKITIKKLDSTTSEINLVTAFSLDNSNIIIYLTNENPDIVNVAVKTAVGLDSMPDELFQKVTEALKIRNTDIFKNNTINVAGILSEIGKPKKFRINGEFDEVINNLNTMYKNSGKKVLQAEEKAPFPISNSISQEVISAMPQLSNNTLEQTVNSADNLIIQSPVEAVASTLPSSFVPEQKISEEPKFSFGEVNSVSPSFPTNPEIFVSPSETESKEHLKFSNSPTVEDLEYKKILEGVLGAISMYPENSLPEGLANTVEFYKNKLIELDKKYENKTNNLKP